MKRYWIAAWSTPFLAAFLAFRFISSFPHPVHDGMEGIFVLLYTGGTLVTGLISGGLCAANRCCRLSSILAINLLTIVPASMNLQGEEQGAFFKFSMAALINGTALWLLAVFGNTALGDTAIRGAKSVVLGQKTKRLRINAAWLVLLAVPIPLISSLSETLPAISDSFLADPIPFYANASGLVLAVRPAVHYERQRRYVAFSDPPSDFVTVGNTCTGQLLLKDHASTTYRPITPSGHPAIGERTDKFGSEAATTQVFSDSPDFIFLWQADGLRFSFDRGTTFQRVESRQEDPPALVVQSGRKLLVVRHGRWVDGRLDLEYGDAFAFIEQLANSSLKYREGRGVPASLGWRGLKAVRSLGASGQPASGDLGHVVESKRTVDILGLEGSVDRIDVPDLTHPSTMSCNVLSFGEVRRNGVKPT